MSIQSGINIIIKHQILEVYPGRVFHQAPHVENVAFAIGGRRKKDNHSNRILLIRFSAWLYPQILGYFSHKCGGE